MQRHRQSQILLSPRDRRALEEVLSGGLQPVRTVCRALALQGVAEGRSARQVAAGIGLAAKTVGEIRDRYRQGGWERALYDKPRPGAVPKLDARQRQRVIAMVCSEPPAGPARWTVRLITTAAVKRKLIPKVGRETIRVLLPSHDLQPWREKNVVRGRSR
ncbi:MAG TPA: helix-turn-helix domain-containing protein [Candidatus Acidoferrum sp.]|nr:helix-turn-helix domain-containing protein [Candidatus Acidoferrum sp.]